MTHLEFINEAKKMGISVHSRKRTVYQSVERLALRGNKKAYILLLKYLESFK